MSTPDRATRLRVVESRLERVGYFALPPTPPSDIDGEAAMLRLRQTIRDLEAKRDDVEVIRDRAGNLVIRVKPGEGA